jgi:uracil-DNA glycosylase family 4
MPSHDPATLAPGDLAALLHFYADAGVDCLLEDAAIDRVAESRQARAERAGPRVVNPATPSIERAASPLIAEPRPAASQNASAAAPTLAVPDETALKDARDAAAAAGSIEELRSILGAFNGCNLKFSAKSLVFADGDPGARVMFVGDAPGRDEDIQGVPFVGRAGQLLDRMLAAIDLDRRSVYLTNMIFWRPPGNRTPTPHEIEACRPFAQRHIELANPEIVVFLGNVATRSMLGTAKGIRAVRGEWLEFKAGGRTWPALPMLDPDYLLRNPAHKKMAWQDLLALKARLQG